MALKIGAILAALSFALVQVDAAKCFHNSVPFMTKQNACATMVDPTLMASCLASPYAPLFYIPNTLSNQAIVAKNTYNNTSPQFIQARLTAAVVLANYTTIVLQQEQQFLSASIAANQTCYDQNASPLDLVGAAKKLAQAQTNYNAAYSSYLYAQNLLTNTPHKRDLSGANACSGVVLPDYCNGIPGVTPMTVCECNKWFTCQSTSIKNCYNGSVANTINLNCVIDSTISAMTTYQASRACLPSNIASACVNAT